MGYKVITIEPKLDFPEVKPQLIRDIPKEIQVIFTCSKPKLSDGKRNQTVTTCIFRNHLDYIGIGCTVENPNDKRNDEEGRRWAFKRAVQSMLNLLDYKKSYYVNKKL